MPTVITGTDGVSQVQTGSIQSDDLAAGVGGKVLQVVQGDTSTYVLNSTTTFVDTGLSATITPASTSSIVLVIVSQPCSVFGGDSVGFGYQLNMGVQLLRGSTVLQSPTSDSGGKYTINIGYGTAPTSGLVSTAGVTSFNYIDSPATTSATTYKTQFAKGTSGMDGAEVNYTNGRSTITLMEIAG